MHADFSSGQAAYSSRRRLFAEQGSPALGHLENCVASGYRPKQIRLASEKLLIKPTVRRYGPPGRSFWRGDGTVAARPAAASYHSLDVHQAIVNLAPGRLRGKTALCSLKRTSRQSAPARRPDR